MTEKEKNEIIQTIKIGLYSETVKALNDVLAQKELEEISRQQDAFMQQEGFLQYVDTPSEFMPHDKPSVVTRTINYLKNISGTVVMYTSLAILIFVVIFISIYLASIAPEKIPQITQKSGGIAVPGPNK